MSMAYHVALCERIREHCHERNWYGSDYELKARLRHSQQPRFRSRDEQFTGFLRPPATEVRLREVERALAFGLPPALRAVYTQVADGGFGPAAGLLSAAALARTLTQGSWLLSERAVAHLDQHPGHHLYWEDEPAGLITLCEWDPGYGVYSKLEGRTGRVLDVSFSVYPPEAQWNSAIVVRRQAQSVEEWFERWMARGLLPWAYEAANDTDTDDTDTDDAEKVGMDSPEPESPSPEPSDADWSWYIQQMQPDENL